MQSEKIKEPRQDGQRAKREKKGGPIVPGASGTGFRQTAESMETVRRCMEAWVSLEQLRRERARNIRYKNGKQWSDPVEDPSRKGCMMTEEALLERDGKTPLTHNFIQQFVRNIVGQVLTNPTQSVVHARADDDKELSEMLTNTLQACHYLNHVSTLDMTVVEEFLLSGVCCVKVRYDYWENKRHSDGKLETVPVGRLFFNRDLADNRMFDLRLIGQLHDYTLEEILNRFARCPEDEPRLRELFSWHGRGAEQLISSFSAAGEAENLSFLNPADPAKRRVIEVWERRGGWRRYVHDYADGSERIDNEAVPEAVDRINRERIEAGRCMGIAPECVPLLVSEQRYEYTWWVTYLTTGGVVLKEMETPFEHREHPYVLCSLPMVDGQVRSPITDLIDMQRYINRLIVMIDFIMGASAKGVLMIPENAIPDGCSVEDFTNEYVKANGVIVYKPNNTRDVPFQIASNSTNVGAWEMLNLQMQLIEKISGISGAIQGERARGNMPSSLYRQEAENSQINYRVLFETLRDFQRLRDEKLLKVLMQYYRQPRYVDIAGSAYHQTAQLYEPRMAREVTDFNLVVSQSVNTPVYRQILDDSLFDMLRSGYIDMEMYLTNTSLPYADKLLNQLRMRKAGEERQRAAEQEKGA